MLSIGARAFLAQLAEPALQPDTVARAVDALVEEGRAAWPGHAVDEEAFGRWLGQRPGVEGGVAGLRAADAYLAFACAQGIAGALQAFEDRHLVELPSELRRAGLEPLADEVAQLLRVKLFFRGDGQDPAIARFSGRVELGAWFRVVALRTALNLRRSTRREVPIEEEIETQASLVLADPELAHLRERYKQDLVAAFHEAVLELAPKDRHVLHLHYVDRASIDAIAAVHRIHRATAARRLVRIREALIDRTRALLGQRLALTESELASLLRIFRSTVDVDLTQILRGDADPDGG